MMSTPGTAARSAKPASPSAHATPSGYAAQPLTASGESSAMSISAISSEKVLPTRMRVSSRTPTAAKVRRSIPNGSTKPSL